MSRMQIVVICLVVIVIWMGGRWLVNRGKGKGAGGRSASGDRTGARSVTAAGGRSAAASVDEINQWYQDAREQIAMMDQGELVRRERAWNALADAEKLAASEAFLEERFGPKARRGFTRQEKLEIGKTARLTRPETSASSGSVGAAGSPQTPPSA
ncbi:MAG TPA: hypothetical protein VFH83_13860 [Spirochaetia bacterium]|nr:hypothetical protein [Spirochaetia bacterium]